MEELLFKVLDGNGRPFHGGKGEWYLPEGNKPGRWMPEIRGNLIECKNGYHLCRKQDLIIWLGPNIYLAEYRGDRIDGEDKIIVRQARLLKELNTWNIKTARLFACDCAEHVLHIYEKQYPDDSRPHRAIEAARLYVDGKIIEKELDAVNTASDAAADAAWAAANTSADAAAKAAWAAANAACAITHATMNTAYAATNAANAATNAANAAAKAAWAAARDVARIAERKWQTSRLMHLLGRC